MMLVENSGKPLTFVTSAPGKVILFGEHAVVYGKTAIAASIDLRTSAYCTTESNNEVQLICPDIDYHGIWQLETLRSATLKFKMNASHVELKEILKVSEKGSENALERLRNLNIDVESMESEFSGLLEAGLDQPQKGAALAFLTLLGLLFASNIELLGRGFRMVVESKLPVGAGLGSSASFSVSVGGALLNIFSPGFLESMAYPLELVNRLGYLAERIIHGNPSGVDNTVSTYGKFVTYQGGKFNKLNGLSSLRILLTNSRVPRNTKKMVAGVRALRDQFPRVVDPILEAIDNIAHTLNDLLVQNKDPISALHNLVVLNHQLLCCLGVSHSSLEKIVDICKLDFGLAAKLTGAGGGGCILTLLPDGLDEIPLSNSLASHGFDVFPTTLGGDGFHLLSKPANEIHSQIRAALFNLKTPRSSL